MKEISDPLATIDVLFQHLGWAQHYKDLSGSKCWRLHEPGKVWKAVKDSVLIAEGTAAVKWLADRAKDQPADKRLSWLKVNMSDRALTTLCSELEKERAANPVPADLPSLEPPLSPDEVKEMVDMLAVLAQADDNDTAIALMEAMSPEHQAQVIAAQQGSEKEMLHAT